MGLVLLTALTLGLCYLALNRDTSVDADLAVEHTAPIEPLAPGGAPSSPGTPTPSEQPSEAPTVGQVGVPEVQLQRLADFTKGDELPDGAVTYDSPSSSSGLRLTTEGLTHGPVTRGSASEGLGLVEAELKTEVRSLGVRVRFARGESGFVRLTAWETSAVSALDQGADSARPSGMQLEATNGRWRLSFVSSGGESVLGQGTFEPSSRPVDLRVVRDGDELFVVDPSGAVTRATKPHVENLIGAFASWGLAETSPQQTPAVIESVWAG